MLKGSFKESHPVFQLFLCFIFVIFGALSGGLIWTVVAFIKSGFSPQIFEIVMNNLYEDAAVMREMQFFSSLGTFILPSLILAYLFSSDYKDYLKLDTPWDFPTISLTVLSMIAALPLLNFLSYYNMQISFPEALKPLEDLLRSMEDENIRLMEMMLYTENIGDFIFNILIIAVLAGIGEEFLFRGVIQNIFGKFNLNIHWVIWIVAIIFSAVHFQFFGFIPRMLLGAYFGYLLYYTRNMWAPVIAHFTNNLIVVGLYRVYQDEPEKIEEIDAIGIGSLWWMVLISLALFIVLFLQIKKRSQLQGFLP